MHKLTVTGIENCQRRENLEKQFKGRVGKQGHLPLSIHVTPKGRQSINMNGVISSEKLDWIVASIVARTIESEGLVLESHLFHIQREPWRRGR